MKESLLRHLIAQAYLEGYRTSTPVFNAGDFFHPSHDESWSKDRAEYVDKVIQENARDMT